MSTDGPSGVLTEVKPESVPLNPLDGAAAPPEQELLCIFGTGDFGRSLGQRLQHSGYRMVYGSRRPGSCGPVPQGAQVKHLWPSLAAALLTPRPHFDFHIYFVDSDIRVVRPPTGADSQSSLWGCMFLSFSRFSCSDKAADRKCVSVCDCLCVAENVPNWKVPTKGVSSFKGAD